MHRHLIAVGPHAYLLYRHKNTAAIYDVDGNMYNANLM